jgi:hypothetical protein
MAKIISYEAVNETWQRMAETPPDQIQAIVDQMEQEQPVLMVYLLALEDYPFNVSEKEIIFYIGTVVWQILKESKASLSSVTPEIINHSEEENYQFLDLLSNDTEADFMSATRAMIDSYPEPEVLRYLVEALMEDDVDYDEITEGMEADVSESPLSEENGDEDDGFESLFNTGEEDDIEVEVIFEEEEEDGLGEVEWDEDDPDIRPENRGLAFVHLKTALDALIASRNTA